MALYPRPLQAILDAIAAQNNGLALVESQYTFGTPTPLATPTPTENTSLQITALVPDSPYEGNVTVNYLRLDLNDLATLLPQPIQITGITSTIDLMTALNTFYGFNLTTADIVNSPVTLTNGAGDVTLVAKSDSMGWINQVTLSVIPGRYVIGSYVSTSELAGLYYPAQDTTKPFAALYSYPWDFSAQFSNLNTIAVSDTPSSVDLTTIATALQAIIGDGWVIDSANRFSLLDAKILYNGLTSGDTRTNQTLYTYAMVIQVSSSCLGYSGNLILNYNDPGSSDF